MQLVLRLRAAVLADRGDARQLVPQTNRALGLVAVLPAGSRGAIAIDLGLRDQRVVAREQMIGARHGSVRRGLGRGRRSPRRGLAGLEIDVDAGLVASAAVLDARDRLAERSDE